MSAGMKQCPLAALCLSSNMAAARTRLGSSPSQPHAQRQSVGLREAAAYVRGGQNVRVLPQHVHGGVAVVLVEPDGQQGPQLVRAEEFHQPPQPRLPAEGGAYLLGLARAYAPDEGEFFRLALYDVQRALAEALDYQRRRGGAHALHGVPGQVLVYGLRAVGQAALGVLGLELPAMAGVGAPLAEGPELLAGIGGRQGAHHGGQPPVQRVQAQHGVAVLLVGVDYRGDAPAYLYVFRLFRHFSSTASARTTSP